MTRNTITELSAMYDELVVDIHGRVPYAISISLSTSRMKQVGEKNLLKPLRETAEAISKELGFNVREA